MTDVEAWVNSHQSPNGGYTKTALESMGVSWPPGKGWRRRLIRGKSTRAKAKVPARPGLAARRAWYREVYLKSPHWRALKAKKRQEEPAACGHCLASDHVDLHHLYYPKNVYATRTRHVMWLCRTCHDRTHQFSTEHKRRIRAEVTMEGRRLVTIRLLKADTEKRRKFIARLAVPAA